jgi:hypothetical protein
MMGKVQKISAQAGRSANREDQRPAFQHPPFNSPRKVAAAPALTISSHCDQDGAPREFLG